ncbi:MAG: HMA2 domain-containing protein [Bacillus sp. (in: firmicutes)]
MSHLNTIVSIAATMVAPKLMANLKDQKVTVVHAIPGRVRLQCNKWKNEPTARNLVKVFKSFPIVKKVEASPITGSLTLQFHIETMTQEQFNEIVQTAVDTSVATYPEMQADLMSILKNVVKTVDNTIKKESSGKADVASLLSVVLIINGVLKMPMNPTFSSSLLYWAYTIITKNHNGSD